MKFALLSKEFVNPTATNLSSGEINTHDAESATPVNRTTGMIINQQSFQRTLEYTCILIELVATN